MEEDTNKTPDASVADLQEDIKALNSRLDGFASWSDEVAERMNAVYGHLTWADREIRSLKRKRRALRWVLLLLTAVVVIEGAAIISGLAIRNDDILGIVKEAVTGDAPADSSQTTMDNAQK